MAQPEPPEPARSPLSPGPLESVPEDADSSSGPMNPLQRATTSPIVFTDSFGSTNTDGKRASIAVPNHEPRRPSAAPRRQSLVQFSTSTAEDTIRRESIATGKVPDASRMSIGERRKSEGTVAGQRRMASPPPKSSYQRGVSFDTFDNKDATDFSLTLNYKHRDYKNTRRSRTWLCGLDRNDYSQYALEWLLEELTDDNDEIVCFWAVEKDSKIASDSSVEKRKYRDEARVVMDWMIEKNSSESNRAVSLVLELVVGKIHDAIRRMIEIYEPANLIVGTRGRSRGGVQALLSGSVSKYCLQECAIPTIVVPSDKRRKEAKKKRMNDPTRRNYTQLLDLTRGGSSLSKANRNSIVEGPLPVSTDEEAAAVSRAIGVPKHFKAIPLSQLTIARSESRERSRSPRPLSAGSGNVVMKSPTFGPIDTPEVSDEDSDDDPSRPSPRSRRGGKNAADEIDPSKDPPWLAAILESDNRKILLPITLAITEIGRKARVSRRRCVYTTNYLGHALVLARNNKTLIALSTSIYTDTFQAKFFQSMGRNSRIHKIFVFTVPKSLERPPTISERSGARLKAIRAGGKGLGEEGPLMPRLIPLRDSNFIKSSESQSASSRSNCELIYRRSQSDQSSRSQHGPARALSIPHNLFQLTRMLLPKDDCDDCIPEHARVGTYSATLSAIPFVATFFLVTLFLVKKVYPFVSPLPDGGTRSEGRQPLSGGRDVFRCISAWAFAVTIGLSAVLTELLLCEISHAFHPWTRKLVLHFTVPSLVGLLLLCIPLLEIHSVILGLGWRTTDGGSLQARTTWAIELATYAGFLTGFWFLGAMLPQDDESLAKDRPSLLIACLERLGITGTLMLALLSGFAAVSSIWQTFLAKPHLVTETDIVRKETGYSATLDLIGEKQRRLDEIQSQMAKSISPTFLHKAWSSVRRNSIFNEADTVELEISGLKTMSSTLESSLHTLRNQRASQVRASTPSGRLVNSFSYIFALYCIYRILSSLVSVLHRHLISSPTPETPSNDLVTSLLTLYTSTISSDINTASFSRHLSLFFSTTILLLSFNAALQTLHLLSRFSPRLLHAARSNLALLAAQVVGLYVISSALLLRNIMPTEVGGVVNQAFGMGREGGKGVLGVEWTERWFEGWFLLAVGATAGGIWLVRKFGDQESWDDGDVEMGKMS